MSSSPAKFAVLPSANGGPDADGSPRDAASSPSELVPNACLRGVDLSDRDLSGVDLRGADLSEANLSRANLGGANLQGCALFSARLDEADFFGADLRGADLTQCRGSSTSFGGADLRDAVAFGAHLPNITLSRAQLGRADFRTATLTGARVLDADFTEAVFDGADLSEALVEDCECVGASFERADFSNGTLRRIGNATKVNWVGARTVGVDFTGAFVLRRTIHDQNFLHEFRTTDRVHSMIYWVWWATSDCGRSLGRWFGCVLAVAVLFGACFGLVDIDFGDSPTWLSSYYFSVVTLTTLGYGDVLPVSAAAQTMVMVEVAVGYMMLGGMLSIFSNKMARRAD